MLNLVPKTQIRPRSFYSTSGCQITVHESGVTKTAASKKHLKRLETQRKFMEDVGPPLFPKVTGSLQYSYIMEPLLEVDWQQTSPVFVLGVLKGLLRSHIWTRPAKLGNTWLTRLIKYVTERLDQVNPPLSTRAQVMNLFPVLSFLAPSLEVCEIHGDPTLDNCMVRNIGANGEHQLVVCDPLYYAEGCMPPLKAVDLGKMLQSAVGYENITRRQSEPFREGDARFNDRDILVDRVLCDENTYTRAAALIFLVVHIVRLMPYQTRHRNEFLVLLSESAQRAQGFIERELAIKEKVMKHA